MLLRHPDTDDSRFPQDAWVPGEFGEPRTLLATPAVNLRLERGRAHPNGVLVSLTIRVPEPLSRDDQRSLAENVMSFHAGSGHTGPCLAYRASPSDGWTQAMPWGHGGARALWTLQYWIPLDPDSRADLGLLFEWPDKAVIERIDYPGQEWTTARGRAEYTGIGPR